MGPNLCSLPPAAILGGSLCLLQYFFLQGGRTTTKPEEVKEKEDMIYDVLDSLESESRFCVGSVCSLAIYSGVVCIFLGKLDFFKILEDMPAKRAVLLLLDV